MIQKTSKDGIDLIKGFEGCRLKAYMDSNGRMTIGYGHAQDVTIDMIITQQQADQFLADDLCKFESYVNDYITEPLTQHQFDALISFTYNLGPNVLHHSRLLTALNSGNMTLAADGFLDYDHAGGKIVADLTKRRHAERELFLTSETEVTEPKPTSFWDLIKDIFKSA